MKIVYTPNLIVRELTPDQRQRIVAAEPTAVIVEAKDAAKQRAEIADAGAKLVQVSGQHRRDAAAEAPTEQDDLPLGFPQQACRPVVVLDRNGALGLFEVARH